MDFDFTGSQPLFMQVADQLRAGIISGALPEGEQVPSTTEISRTYTINPATLLEKRRGLGMFVVPGAMERLRREERERFERDCVTDLVAEARRLGIGCQELIGLIEKGYRQ